MLTIGLIDVTPNLSLGINRIIAVYKHCLYYDINIYSSYNVEINDQVIEQILVFPSFVQINHDLIINCKHITHLYKRPRYYCFGDITMFIYIKLYRYIFSSYFCIEITKQQYALIKSNMY